MVSGGVSLVVVVEEAGGVGGGGGACTCTHRTVVPNDFTRWRAQMAAWQWPEAGGASIDRPGRDIRQTDIDRALESQGFDTEWGLASPGGLFFLREARVAHLPAMRSAIVWHSFTEYLIRPVKRRPVTSGSGRT